MALFNHLFPYINLHDINLDWINSTIKSIDPAVIQALQELTPNIIEQVNQNEICKKETGKNGAL